MLVVRATLLDGHELEVRTVFQQPHLCPLPAKFTSSLDVDWYLPAKFVPLAKEVCIPSRVAEAPSLHSPHNPLHYGHRSLFQYLL